MLQLHRFRSFGIRHLNAVPIFKFMSCWLNIVFMKFYVCTYRTWTNINQQCWLPAPTIRMEWRFFNKIFRFAIFFGKRYFGFGSCILNPSVLTTFIPACQQWKISLPREITKTQLLSAKLYSVFELRLV